MERMKQKRRKSHIRLLNCGINNGDLMEVPVTVSYLFFIALLVICY